MEDQSQSPAPQSDPRVYFAEERTFLAWLRTGLGLMGIGFAVARFGLFLRQLQATSAAHATPHATPHTSGLSLWSGVALVALGVIVCISAVVRHLRTVRELREGTWQAGRVSTTSILLGVLLSLVGIGMAAYLLVIR
jgi:putative membrane protein